MDNCLIGYIQRCILRHCFPVAFARNSVKEAILMKKRVITLVLAVFVCFMSVIPAFAEEGFIGTAYRVIPG